MTDIANLEAWAITQGYDPDHNYDDDEPDIATPEPELPPPSGDQLSPHFRAAEFACRHCGQLHPDGVPVALLNILEDVREHFGKPVIINSGYRCPTHNANVGGAKGSQHMKGTAADIRINGVSPADVYAYLDPWHDGGLGRYNSFTHVDVRNGRARWSG